MSSLPSMRQLRYFVALAETRHFRRAAEAVGISQPSLSLQIGNLEELLGTQLIERGRGPVTLTPVGREVLTLARRTLDDAQEILDATAAMRGGLSGTIRLGASPSLGPYLLPRVVGQLHKAVPRPASLHPRTRAPAAARGAARRHARHDPEPAAHAGGGVPRPPPLLRTAPPRRAARPPARQPAHGRRLRSPGARGSEPRPRLRAPRPDPGASARNTAPTSCGTTKAPASTRSARWWRWGWA